MHGHKANRLCSFTQGPLLASTLYRPPSNAPRPYTPHPPSFSESNDHIQVSSLPSRVKFQPIAPSFLTADPPGITTEQSNAVQRELISLMDQPWNEWYPKVCISYATGTRKGTYVPGAGPGMMQAAAITHALYNAGIACASGLCVPAGNDWKDSCPRLSRATRVARCSSSFSRPLSTARSRASSKSTRRPRLNGW